MPNNLGIAILSLYLSGRDGGIISVIPVLGALAIAAQKLFPILQQAYYSYSTIRGAKSSFQDVLNLLNQPFSYNVNDIIKKPISFNKTNSSNLKKKANQTINKNNQYN